MHETYIIPGIVDGQVAHDQAAKRAQDYRDPGETIVHAHRQGEDCNDKCKFYPIKRED
jgi:hypothetical protein